MEEKIVIERNIESKLTNKSYSEKSGLVAFLLCIFFGALGIHRFYVGKIITGILWLVTIGLFGFGVIIDMIFIVTGKFKDNNELPLHFP